MGRQRMHQSPRPAEPVALDPFIGEFVSRISLDKVLLIRSLSSLCANGIAVEIPRHADKKQEFGATVAAGHPRLVPRLLL